MTALTRVLRDTTAVNIQSIQNLSKPMKPLFSRSVSAPLPQSPVLDERPIEVETVASEVASIFRSTTISEEPEDMWTLKRATPIDESEDEESVCLMESPTKRIRRTFSFYDPFPESRDEEESQIVELSWNTQICETESGFNLVL